MQTITLLGDSILDNASYTRPEPDTTAHLRRLLPDWSVQCLAQDGSTMSGVRFQLQELDHRPSVGVLSVGGNDAMAHIELLDKRVSTSAETLRDLLAVASDFADRYEGVARAVLEQCERTVFCTIYEVALEPPRYAELARVPLAILNDRIVQIASRLGADVLDLRTVCTEPEDFVLQIEPSARGARKIAEAIARVARAESGLAHGRVFAA